jgi:cytochrome c oxidase subunit 2
LGGVVVGARARASLNGERVELAVSKFEFSRAEIHARRGRALTIALTATDFLHGFAVPELGPRTDCSPGRTVELAFTPERAGRFTYLSDNFCGEGHDRMHGVLIVTDAA